MTTLYSRSAIRAVPAGRMTFPADSALTTSLGDSPFAASTFGSMSTLIWRDLPPYGAGDERPGMVNSFTRMKLSP